MLEPCPSCETGPASSPTAACPHSRRRTRSAFRLCAAHGVSWFEFDCDVLADGTVVVIHDATLDRTTDRTGGYQTLVAADLEGIDAGSWFAPEFAGEALPTLPRVIALMNEVGLDANLEIKSGNRAAAPSRLLLAGIARDLVSLDPARDLLVSSFNPVLLGEFRRLAPGGRWHAFSGIAGTPPCGARSRNSSTRARSTRTCPA